MSRLPHFYTGIYIYVCVVKYVCVHKGIQLWYELQATRTWWAAVWPRGGGRWIKSSSCWTTPDRTPVCAQGRHLQQWGGVFSLVLPTVLI
jgi:hypothetical protein